jgi:uncharacterized protein (TIGR03435 family)
MTTKRHFVTGIGLLSCFLTVRSTSAQSPTPPTPRLAFDVASIKPNKSGTKGGGIGFRGGRLNATNVTLRQLVAQAYGLRADGVQDLGNRIVGGPGWVATERYDVVARAEQPVSQEEALNMAQTLLGERFQLKVHRETREMPIYELVIGKNGPKFKQSEAEGEAGISQGAVEGRYRVTAHKMPMFVLASMLENQIDRIVVDKTGIEGPVDFQVEWALDLNAKTTDVSAPSVFSAVQEQLGLRLESKKGPVEIIVIDSAERASEN